MFVVDQKKAAKDFIKEWSTKEVSERGGYQIFWIELLQNVLGDTNAPSRICPEEKVKVDNHTNFIDIYLPDVKVIIEQKKRGIKLDEKAKQSDGSSLTPFEQAKKYNDDLRADEKALYIVTSNFDEIWVYDMNPKVRGVYEPVKILLKNLADQYQQLAFLVNKKERKITQEVKVSTEAGSYIAKIHDLFLKQYKDPNSPETLKSLNKLCVRLVFCFYAEDAYLFPEKNYFQKYTRKYTGSDYRKAIIEVFKILDTPESQRDPYIDEDLNKFPYVNGGLFKEENIEIPRIDDELREEIIEASEFDWSQISPTIFGAVFESTLNPETRRAGGMHYTSIENIHKVIDPLFFDDLNDEFNKIINISKGSDKNKALKTFQDKIASLKFLDPACGSGNFLTETYVSLRRLENEIIRILHNGQMFLGIDEGKTNPIKISISQFYGIEINDFAVTVAKTALWIAESQMMRETEDIVLNSLDFLPLKTNATIVEGNALRIDWESVVPKSELNYIMGNPPFVGRRYRTVEQQKDISSFFDYKDIDYVACWFYKASEYIYNAGNNQNCHCEPSIDGLAIKKNKVAFVSTNSITQGEQVTALWKVITEKFNVDIDFAYKTFKWNSEASDKAAVHCVIIGFSCGSKISPLLKGNGCDSNQGDFKETKEKISLSAKADIPLYERGYLEPPTKRLYANGKVTLVNQINGYLLDAPNVFIENRSKPLCDVPPMKNGNVPLDGDALKIEADDLAKFNGFKYIKQLIGGRELLYNEKRYVLWLVDVPISEIKGNKEVLKRVEQCRANRLAMKDKATQKLAEFPTRFRDTNNPENYIALPMVSSENRQYIPMAYLHDDVIPTNQVQTIPEASIYHFGVLTSSIHMSWMRVVCGRLKSDYRYSKDIVYNNFPWCTPSDIQKAKIEQTAQAILNAREKYPNECLANLYAPTFMPKEYKKAHQANDEAVLEAYGLPKNSTESEIVAHLMNLYKELTSKP